jgi:hypothetical protein
VQFTDDAGKLSEAHGPYFGQYGGRWVAEALVVALDDLTQAWAELKDSPEFLEEMGELSRSYIGRPSLLTEAPRFGEHAGGARVLLKREDLNHTGSHKINNVIGQGLLTKKVGKKRIIAETGAGQHGVATATAAALMGLECTIYMGAEDVRRQARGRLRHQRLADPQGRDLGGVPRLGHERRDHQLRLRHGRGPAPVPGARPRPAEGHRRGGARAGPRAHRQAPGRRGRLHRRRVQRDRPVQRLPRRRERAHRRVRGRR